MNVPSFHKVILALVPVILVYSSGLSGDTARVSLACGYEAAIEDHLRKADWQRLPSEAEMQSIWDETHLMRRWSRGPFTTAGIVVINYETNIPSHIVKKECLALREVQPGNNKVLLFQAVDCGVDDHWGPGVYVAHQDCRNDHIYHISNALLAGHLHDIILYVSSFAANGLPSDFMYRPVEDTGSGGSHPGHGKAN